MQQGQQAQALPSLSQSQAQLARSLWQPGQDAPHQKPIIEQMTLVRDKWDPSNPSCVFKHYFYNKVDEANIPFYKPQPHEDPREWEEALQNKPAPSFMPVLCSGYAGVADRLKTQKRAINEFNTRLHQVNGSLDAILQRHELDTEVRALAARRRQVAITQRCLALASRVQILRNRGYALSADEDDLKGRLQALEREVQDPAVGAREEELWSRLIVLRGYADQLNKELDKPAGADGTELDNETESKAKRVLEDYEKQIQHLKKEVEALGLDYTEWETSRTTNTKAR
jgi:nuclear pore complex protein Nup54